MTQIQRTLEALGGGNFDRGLDALLAVASRMAAAREKHPLFAEGAYQALGVVGAEYRELERAVEHESPERQRDEALDVAVTALRFWLGEHESPRREAWND